MTVLIKLIPPSFSEGTCFATEQQRANAIIGGTTPQLLVSGVSSFFNFGDDLPPPENQIFPWWRTVGGRMDGVYVYAGGYWGRPHPTPAGDSEIRMWRGDLTALESYDGGSPGAVTDFTGPMWEEDEDMRGLSPMGAIAQLPVSLTAFPLDTVLGEEQHTLLKSELPTYNLDVTPSLIQKTPGSGAQDGFLFSPPGSGSGDAYSPTNITVGTGGSGTPFNVVGPVRAVYFIKRTLRIFITV